MKHRFLIFMLVAMALLMVNQMLNAPRQPADADKDKAAANKDDKQAGAKEKEKGDAEQDPPQDENAKKPRDKPKIVEPPREARRLTIGSIDPASGYSMLVTLTTKGAAIERVELSNPRYRDIDDRSGYLGNLAPSDSTAERGPGCIVGVVGDGTPAKDAGLQVGDLITAINDHTIGGAETFLARMNKTKPGQTIALAIQRTASKDAPPEVLQIEVPLVRRPLEVCRPEIENYNSRGEELPKKPNKHVDHPTLLMTLQEINGSILSEDKDELPGIEMRDGHWEVLPGESNSEVEFRRVIAEHELEVVKHYWLEKTEDLLTYDLRFEIKFTNLAKAPQKLAYRLDGPTGLPTEGHWYATKIGPNWTGGAGLRDFVLAQRTNEGFISDYTFVSAHNIASEKIPSMPEEKADRSLAFVGVDAQYFAAVLLPEVREGEEIRFASAAPLLVGGWNDAHQNRANISTRLITTPINLEAGATISQSYRFFAGPKEPEVLEKQEYNLHKLIVYGWFGFVARPMTSLLHGLSYAGGFGMAIILLTVIVRLCMFPLSRKQVMGAQKMQQLQPEMKKLAEKYKEDRPTLAKKQQELFRKHNYNPLSGCLLLFVQLPIFIGLYRALSVDIALRDAGLFGDKVGGWCSNLTAPDMLYNWSGWMPEFLQGMLGPYLNILPLITVVLFLVQQKMFMPPPADETAAMQQKVMTFMMIFIGFMFYTVASGLCVYFIVSSLWGIIERKVLPKTSAAAVEPLPETREPSKIKAMPSGNGSGQQRAKQKKKGRR